jgi:diguanylate cyclase (GGDEF)-like protein
MRRSLLTILAGAVALLVVAVSGGVSRRTGELTRERNDLAHEAMEHAQILDAYFARASSVILLTANNPAFRQFYAEPGDRARRVRRGGPTLDLAAESLGYLERLYPDRIGEACFIDASGAENARMVRGERATVEDLSPDESRNPFFAPSFALRAGEVHQAKPYVSPDTDEWVIANATPVPMADGSKQAIVHFEVTLESFRREASHSSRAVLVVDADTGDIVINSVRPQQIGAPLGDPGDGRFRPLVGGWGGGGLVRLGDRQAAYQQIASTPGNANRWYVVAVSDHATGPMTGVGALPVMVAIAAMLLIGYLLLVLRRGESVLVSAANTDALTGLHNRRRLLADLDIQITRASDEDPLLLVLLDLNGFKSYNDTFGHPAGDALLTRIGGALARNIRGRGTAYRIGGDEFCILARPGHDGVDGVIDIGARSLSEHGDGFSITASYGAVLLPADALTATEALRQVDLRMYENKTSGRVPADAQTMNALMRAMRERDPECAERMTRTAELVGDVCRELGVSPAEEARIRQAAQLHDVGKVGIPDNILRKPGPLSPLEWDFMRQSPVIGERITAAAPALVALAPLIRSARESYDGTGYPDRLAGEGIPLGARIIAACSALVAMTSDRPHAARRDLPAALDEIGRGAGTQFDPRVVRALRQAALRPVTTG